MPLTLQCSAFLGSDPLASSRGFDWGNSWRTECFCLAPGLCFPVWEQVTAEGRGLLPVLLSWEGLMDRDPPVELELGILRDALSISELQLPGARLSWVHLGMNQVSRPSSLQTSLPSDLPASAPPGLFSGFS